MLHPFVRDGIASDDHDPQLGTFRQRQQHLIVDRGLIGAKHLEAAEVVGGVQAVETELRAGEGEFTQAGQTLSVDHFAELLSE